MSKNKLSSWSSTRRNHLGFTNRKQTYMYPAKICIREVKSAEKTCTRLRSLRCIFFEEKPEKHQNASNSKSAETPFYCCWKPKTESEIEQKPHTKIGTKTEKPKFFLCENRKTNLKKLQNRKSQCPPHYGMDFNNLYNYSYFIWILTKHSYGQELDLYRR